MPTDERTAQPGPAGAGAAPGPRAAGALRASPSVDRLARLYLDALDSRNRYARRIYGAHTMHREAELSRRNGPAQRRRERAPLGGGTMTSRKFTKAAARPALVACPYKCGWVGRDPTTHIMVSPSQGGCTEADA